MSWWIVATACAFCVLIEILACRLDRAVFWVAAAVANAAVLVFLYCVGASLEQFLVYALVAVIGVLEFFGRKYRSGK